MATTTFLDSLAPLRHPRHLIAFRVDASGDVIVARVFHESIAGPRISTSADH